MIVSLNWLKKYVDIDMSADDLATLIGSRIVEIEEVKYIGEKYRDVVAVKVVECQKMAGSDHLSVTKIDDGGAVSSVERDENGLVQVVCGAPNVRAGMLAAWLPPNSIVPETFDDSEPFVLSAKPLRGYLSNGMLASARELDLYDDHTGIIEIDVSAKPGDSFAQLYELDDYLFDIENKSLTHRPDAFGIIGFAREVAGVQGVEFDTPDWFADLDAQIDSQEASDAPKVSIDDPELSDRFTAVVLNHVNDVANSPIQIQTYLSRSGVRPINASVDIANYLMLLTGQPLHTYDYDKLLAVAGNDKIIHVRSARKNEKLTLLDGREISLDEADIVIAAGDVAVGLAGAMGGQSTAIDENTENVLLEVATFDLYHLRSTQMRHGIFSEAITRFTKGIPASFARPVLVKAVRLFAEYTGSMVASAVADVYPGAVKKDPVKLTTSKINGVLGVDLSVDEIKKTLKNVNFDVSASGDALTVPVPYWREDVHIAEDIVEEVGRLRGFDNIPFAMPERDFVAVEPSRDDRLKKHIRDVLTRAGSNEVLLYSFVHGDVLQSAGQSRENSYKIINSISPELQYYRQSLTPSLLSLIHPNVKAKYDTFSIYELNKVHHKSDGLNDENVPIEHVNLALVVTSSKNREEDAFYLAKHYVQWLAKNLGIEVKYQRLATHGDPVDAVFEPKRSARLTIDNQNIGVVGEYNAQARKSWKLPQYTAGFEIDIDKLLSIVGSQTVDYTHPSKYPSADRDICFRLPKDVEYSQAYQAVVSSLSSLDYQYVIKPIDIYHKDGEKTRNITFRITLSSYQKTLSGDEISVVMNKVGETVSTEIGGEVV